jgi:hypothetical protein
MAQLRSSDEGLEWVSFPWLAGNQRRNLTVIQVFQTG